MPATKTARLLLAVATGQAVANLPPLLHIGRPGDTVCWLWSDADALASAEACSAHLQRRGLQAMAHPQPLPDVLADVHRWWAECKGRPPLTGRTLTLVANGGTKPLFAALLQAMAGGLHEVVYGEAQPVALLRMPQGDTTRSFREPLARPGLNLEDVLACTGHRFFAGRVPHSRQLLWSNGRLSTPAGRTDDAFLDPGALQACYPFRAAAHGQGPDYPRLFEEAVARRVVASVERRQDWQDVIAEVWLGVKLAAADAPADQAADWDVLLVLRNGVLINIECKTGTSDKKDLDARLQMTHQSASTLAEMWMCTLMPTALTASSHFGDWHRRREQLLAQRGRRHLAWTLPDQPKHYSWNGRRYDVTNFEAQLEALLAPYVP